MPSSNPTVDLTTRAGSPRISLWSLSNGDDLLERSDSAEASPPSGGGIGGHLPPFYGEVVWWASAVRPFFGFSFFFFWGGHIIGDEFVYETPFIIISYVFLHLYCSHK